MFAHYNSPQEYRGKNPSSYTGCSILATLAWQQSRALCTSLHSVLAGFCQLDTNDSSEKREPQWRKCPYQIVL